MSASARVWVALLLTLLISTKAAITAAAAPSIYGLDAAISQRRKVDPEVLNDTFLSLPASIRKSLAHAAHFNTRDRIGFLSSLSVLLPIHVKLVGFENDEPWQLQKHINTYISAIHSDSQVHVIGGSDAEPHDLMVRSKLSLEVTKLPARGLTDRLSDAIRANMEPSSAVMRSNLHSVPYAAVDDIIRSDMESSSEAAYVIYLLNLKGQEKQYAYSYSAKDSSPGFSKCLGTLWMGRARYLWVDLKAGPVDYGPALSGEGLLPRGEFHPLAAMHSTTKTQKDFLADLSSLIWSAVGFLFMPALRIPVYYEPELLVQFIHIHDEREIDKRGLDWGAIEDTFLAEASRGVLLDEQKLKFKKYSVQFSACPACVAAVFRSTRSFTSRFLFDNYTLLVSEYLDSKALHQSLKQAHDDLATIAGIGSDDNYGKTLPVYVLDLGHDRPLMLDRFHQAIAFRDMVVAVRSRSSQSVSDYNCNGRHVITQARNLERPIVGALLQSLWGVAPTHLTWSPRHNHTLVDYTWSVGQTPFGPFSESMSLSFVQKDAAPRNILLTTLNSTISSAIDVLRYVIDHGGEKKLLGHKRHIEFTQRWNMLEYKLDKAVSAISHFDFNSALYFIRSSDHDLYNAVGFSNEKLLCSRPADFYSVKAFFVFDGKFKTTNMSSGDLA
ncbi:hypothetical protein SUGI_0645510 [Cryptomeria japonica]|nr:hypothetical protein SUGI_0645510 [Cryptomeria japonica]